MDIPSKTIKYDSNNKYNGIIQYLKDETGSSNIHKDGIIQVQFSSNQRSENAQDFAPLGINSETKNYWASDPNLNEWYSIDFLKNCVRVDSFVISDYGRDFPKEIIIEGSKNGFNWNIIDQKTIQPGENLFDFSILNFDVSNKITSKLIRFKNKQQRYANDNAFVIYRLEVFGEFISNCKNYLSSNFRFNDKSFFISILNAIII